MAVRAAWPVIRHRKSTGGRHQYRHRSCRASTAGRLYAPPDRLDQRNQHYILPDYRKLNFNFIRDIAPVSSITRQPQAMLANPLFPAKTIPEFIDYAKANPGKVNMSSPGVGTISHLAGELFKMMAGINLVHVPFGGNGPALTALLGGQVDVSVASLPSSIEYVRTGKLRGLGVTTPMRAEALPDVPSVGEFVTGYDVTAWYGVGAPKGTPVDIIDKLNDEINAGLADPKLKARLADFGGTPLVLSLADFGKFIAQETEKWAKVIRAANIKAE